MASAVLILGVICLQAASGTVWWAYARRGRVISAFEAIGIGLALGTFVSMISAMLLAGSSIASVAWAIPAAGTAVWLIVRRLTHASPLARLTVAGHEALAVLLGVAAGLVILLGNWARVPLSGATTDSYTDLYFFEAISRGLAEFGPTQSILMAGGSLRYHWFTYAWAGELAQTSSAASFVTITRVLPLVTLIGVSMLAASWAGSLSRVRWVPSLAVLLITAGGYSGALYGTVLNFDSPSQSMTTLWLIALAIVFLAVVEGAASRVAGLILVAALASAVTGGKISHAAVAAGGIAAVALLAVLSRAARWRLALGASVAAAVSMGVTYVWVLAGVAVDRNLTEDIAVKASTWQGLDPVIGRLGVALGTAALVLAILARVAGISWLLAHKRTRRWNDTIFVCGALLVGLVAMLVLSEGVNELWFVLAASGPAAVLSAVGVGRALSSVGAAGGRGSHQLLLAVGVAVPASLVGLVLTWNWTSHRSVLNWAAPVAIWVLVPAVGIVVSMLVAPRGEVLRCAVALSISALVLTSIVTRPSSLWTSSRPVATERGQIAPAVTAIAPSPGHEATALAPSTADASAGAAWLVANSGSSDIVATADPVSAVVPALTGRQMYLAGDLYQVGLGKADEIDTIAKRRQVSLSLPGGLSAEARRDLCAAGVDWLWVPADSAGLDLPAEFSDASVKIVRLPTQGCAAG